MAQTTCQIASSALLSPSAAPDGRVGATSGRSNRSRPFLCRAIANSRVPETSRVNMPHCFLRVHWGDAHVRSHPGIALLGAVLAFLGACSISDACWAAAPAAGEQNSPRIAEIMQRLRNVQRFDAVSVAPDGRSVAWTVTEKPKEARGKTAGQAADSGKPGQLLQVANADGSQVRTITIPQAAKSCRYSNLRWSPDGRTLAFLSNCNHGAKSDEQFDIYEVGASG